MESEWIFVYNRLPSLPDAEEVKQIIQSRDGKPVGWYEIEAMFLCTPGVRACNALDSMVIQSSNNFELLNASLSGPIEIFGQDDFLTKIIKALTIGGEFGVSHSELRENISAITDKQFWPELQIRWDINRFIGRMFLLNHKMESVYLVS